MKGYILFMWAACIVFAVISLNTGNAWEPFIAASFVIIAISNNKSV